MKMIKGLIYSAYYEPEKASSMYLTTELYESIACNGVDIRLFVPVPTRGVSDVVRKQYIHKKKYEEKCNGNLKICHIYMPKEKKNAFLRALRYVLLNLAFIFKSLKIKADFIFVQSTPPTQGAMASIIKKIKKIRFIYNLQDVFPDSLVNTGMTHKGSFLWKIGRKIEDYTYKNADKIIVISEGFKKNIMAKGVPEEKIEVISNWIDLDSVHPVNRRDNILISEFSIDINKFIVVYAGNFGAAQGADIVIKAAKELEKNKDIQFVIFGGGAYFEDAKIKAKNLDNVFIHELLSQERVSEVYSLGDVALITCKAGTGNAGMPSKTWSIMACNTPIIASFDTDSDLSDVIKNSGAGVCVEPENVSALVTAIKESYLRWKSGLKSTVSLREYVQRNASKETCIKRYIDTIKKQIEDKN